MKESTMAIEGTSNLVIETTDSSSDVGAEIYNSTNLGERGPVRTGKLQSIEIARLLWGNRRIVARITVWGSVLFTLVAFLLPNHYIATTRLMPPDFSSSADLIEALPSLSTSNENQSSASGVAGLASKLLGFNNTGDLMIGVLQSRTIEDDLIQQFELMKLYSARYPEDARKVLERQTEAKADTKTGVISISVDDKDPRRAAAMAGAYAQELNQVLEQVNTSSARRERIFIERRLTEVKQRLDASAKEFSVFASQNSAVDVPDQIKAMVVAAADLQGQLIAAQSMLRGMQQIYTNENPRVREAQAQVQELQLQLNKMAGKGVSTADGATLSSDQLYPSIRQLPLVGVRYLDLYRRNKIDEAVFELLTKEYELAKLEEARDVPGVQILDQAVVPQKKSSPHRLLIILFGASASFIIGAAWIIGGATWARTNPQNPWKVFSREVFVTSRAHILDSPLIRGVRLAFVRTQKPDSPHGLTVQIESEKISYSDLIKATTVYRIDGGSLFIRHI